ncbi:MAG: VTT domain-containing protein [Clostridia bacterium]|nr:VTT domain-containing protein [Clostridia bacterium]
MNNKKKIRKRDIAILVVTIAILLAIALLCAFNWPLVANLFDLIVRGKTVVQDYVLSFGILGEIIIAIMLLFCFFFPFISSLPLQILCVISYGVVHATILISIVLALASQLLYLLEKNFKTFFYTKKQHQKQEDIEARIKNSSRNINWVMVLLYIVPCIPFLVISSIACRSNMKWWKYTLFTAIGPIPEVIVTLVLGDQLTSNTSPVWSMIVLVVMIAIVILSLVFKDKMIYWIFKPQKETNNCASADTAVTENAVADNDETKDNNDKAK